MFARTARPPAERDSRAALDVMDTFARAITPTAMTLSEPEGLLAWGHRYLAHYFTCDDSPFHRWVATELDRLVIERGQRLCVVAPRGGAKSTWVVTAYCLRAICRGDERFIVVCGETSDQAEQQLASIRHELEQNTLLAADYPDACGQGAKWTERQMVTRNAVRVQALGAGRSIRGRREREARPTLIIIDDPDGEMHAYSEAKRDRTWSWLTRAVEHAGEPRTNIICTGTMIHEDCTVARLLDHPGWTGKKFAEVLAWPQRSDLWERWETILGLPGDPDREGKARTFFAENREEMTKGVEVLWPARWPILELMLIRAKGGHAAFLAERQNEPTPPKGVKWPPEWFAGDDLWFDEPPTDGIALVACDPCVGHSRKGDYAAIVWCWWRKGDRHLYIDADIQRRPTPKTNAALAQIHAMHRFLECAYEATGYQRDHAEDLSVRCAEAGAFLSVRKIEHSEPKEVRIDRLGPYLSSRNFKFRRGSIGAALLLRQLRLYAIPKVEAYDGPDALEMLVGLVRRYLTGLRTPGPRVVGTVAKGV